MENDDRRVAIVHPAGVVPEKMPAVRQLLGTEPDDAALAHLCFEGMHFDASRATVDDPAFLLTRLEPPVDLLLVLPQTSGLFPNAFTAAWLGTLLVRGEARDIYISRDNEEHFQRLIRSLRDALPATVFDEPDKHWLRLRRGAGLEQAVANLPSSYRFLHGRDDDFRDLWPSKRTADAHLRGQLFNASRNSLILERVAQHVGWGPRPRLLDIGGSYGCLGLELAVKGWDATVVDNDPTKTDMVGPWLARLSPQPLAIEFRTMSMEDVASGSIAGDSPGWDVITFFLSFYHAGEHYAPLLRACWEKLAPGGGLFIQEVVPKDATARVDNLQFERDDLVHLITENAAAPSCFSMINGSPSAEFLYGGAGALLATKPRRGAT